MIKIKKNESGFGAVEVIMLVVIIALVAGVGYLVYKNQHKTTKAAVVTKTIKPTSTNTSTTSNTGLVKYSSLSSAPQDIQNGVLAAWDSAEPGYKTMTDATCNSSTPASSYSTNDPIWTYNDSFIVAGAGCASNADDGANLVVKTNGTWSDVGSTQFLFSCATIAKYNVPHSLIIAAMTASSAPEPVQCSGTNSSVNL